MTFHEIYQRHYNDVCRFAVFLTGDRSRAEDLTSDTFVRAWIARDRIKQATVRAYLLTLPRNVYRDQRRREKPTAALDETWPDPRPGIEVQVHTCWRLAASASACATTPEAREIVLSLSAMSCDG